MSVFTPYSTRAAATSTAARASVPIQTILKTAGWSRESTFAKYYKKPLSNPGMFAISVLKNSSK